LRQAGVNPEDIMFLSNEKQQRLGTAFSKQMENQHLPALFTATDSRFSRTLALLKVAEVIAREKFENAYNAAKFHQAINNVIANSPLHLGNAKFDTRSSSKNSGATLSIMFKNDKRNYSVVGNQSPTIVKRKML